MSGNEWLESSTSLLPLHLSVCTLSLSLESREIRSIILLQYYSYALPFKLKYPFLHFLPVFLGFTSVLDVSRYSVSFLTLSFDAFLLVTQRFVLPFGFLGFLCFVFPCTSMFKNSLTFYGLIEKSNVLSFQIRTPLNWAVI